MAASGELRRARVVRVLLVAVGLVVADGAIIGGGILLALTRKPDATSILVGSFASVMLVVGPMVLAALSGFWDRGSSADGRRVFRRTTIVVVVLEFVGAATVVVLAATGRIGGWPAVVVLAGAAVLLAAARPYGSLLRRQERSLRRNSDGVDAAAEAYDRATVRRTVIVFCAAGLLAIVGVVVDAVLEGARIFPGLALTAASLTLFASTFAVLARSLAVGRSLRDAVGGDSGRARRVSRALTRRDGGDLGAEDRRSARVWAPRFLRYQRYTTAWTCLLYSALLLQQIAGVLRGGEFAPINVVVGILLVAVLLVATPFVIRQRRRVRAWLTADASGAMVETSDA